MNRRNFIKVASIIAATFALSGISAHANLLVNGDFEDGAASQYGSVAIPGWTAWGTGGWIYSNAGEILGTRSAKIWSANTGLYQDVAITPGQTYTVIAKLTSFTRTAMIDRSSVITVEWYDSSDMTEAIMIDTVGFFHTGVDPFDVWKSICKQITPPHTANILRVVAMVRDSDGAPNKTANFDEFEVLETPLPADNTPPTPAQMDFAIVPQTEGSDTIVMVAQTAVDASDVEYYFTCTEGSGNDSGWQNSTLYRDRGLRAAAEYTYTVKARDKSFAKNETAASPAFSATTNCVTDIAITNGYLEQDDIVYQNIYPIQPNHYYTVTASITSSPGDPLSNRDAAVKIVWLNGSAVLTEETIGCFVTGVDDPAARKTISSTVISPAASNGFKLIAGILDQPESTVSGSAQFDNISVAANGPIHCSQNDLNADCKVNIDDVALISQQWKNEYAIVELAELVRAWLDCRASDPEDCQ